MARVRGSARAAPPSREVRYTRPIPSDRNSAGDQSMTVPQPSRADVDSNVDHSLEAWYAEHPPPDVGSNNFFPSDSITDMYDRSRKAQPKPLPPDAATVAFMEARSTGEGRSPAKHEDYENKRAVCAADYTFRVYDATCAVSSEFRHPCHGNSTNTPRYEKCTNLVPRLQSRYMIKEDQAVKKRPIRKSTKGTRRGRMSPAFPINSDPDSDDSGPVFNLEDHVLGSVLSFPFRVAPVDQYADQYNPNQSIQEQNRGATRCKTPAETQNMGYQLRTASRRNGMRERSSNCDLVRLQLDEDEKWLMIGGGLMGKDEFETEFEVLAANIARRMKTYEADIPGTDKEVGNYWDIADLPELFSELKNDSYQCGGHVADDLELFE
ncbi:hypothetical protein K505DRAFT_335818 [Melanomma pulvis-pyrius CBS 109.77]|uniref:Uncharacterized protein n=1 Tax=Melanomma pulvis-pyrius CBS 109.77 TaxID=1314802 RepID=A0A6A6XJB1_9PLEO|nr:hypothetical protein K505DRAFT_335818 [Melanomma pulvis-pyrius CBS 109.77]